MIRLGITGRALLALLVIIVVLPLLAAALSVDARWRMRVIAAKVSGDFDSLPWKDLLPMLKPGSGFWLEPLLESPNPYSAIRNPRGSAQDIRTGRALFRYQCVSCHGSGARGGTAPALVGRDLARGSSDWALFRTIQAGVSGTAMQPHDLPANDLWNLVAYLQSEISAASGAAATPSSSAGIAPLGVPFETLRESRSAGSDWPTFYGSYNGYRYSRLDAVNRRNVSQLQARWIHQLPSRAARIESTPLAAGGRLFLTDPEGSVIALDGTTGIQLWRFTPELARNVPLCCVTANRGVALLDDTLFVATLDAHLIALDGTTGKVRWNKVIADYRQGYSSTGAPLVVKNMVITGIAGSEFGAPGFIKAFDATSGRELWRVNTIPKPGEAGNDTWAGESWRTGGASTWMTGTYDPELDLIFWGTANPAPDYDASLRKGDNLYSNSLLALHADTGKMAWYFQYSPGDDHDWDSVQVPMLVDLMVEGVMRKLVLNANRNGFFYALDRATGKFLHAEAYVKQTWAASIDPVTGRPVRRPEASGTEKGALVYPGNTGGTNWWPPTFNPPAGLFIIPALERPGVFFKTAEGERKERKEYLGGSVGATGAKHFTAVRALDPLTGTLRWERRSEPRLDSGDLCGLLSTAGGLVFTSDRKQLIALDVDNGKELWGFHAGANIFTPPATYEVQGEQFIVFVAGDVVIGLALPRATASGSSSESKQQ